MPEKKVVSNTSPLFYLHRIGQLQLLRDLYGRVIIPPAVERELLAGAAKGLPIPAVSEIDWIEILPPENEPFVNAIADLGAGEAGVLALGAAQPDRLLILDDQLGRRIAKLMGARYTGTLGVVLKAKAEGLLQSVAPAVRQLQAAGMYVSDALPKRVVEVAGEQ